MEHLDHHLILGLNKYIQQPLHRLLVLGFIQDHFVNPGTMYRYSKHVFLSFRDHISQWSPYFCYHHLNSFMWYILIMDFECLQLYNYVCFLNLLPHLSHMRAKQFIQFLLFRPFKRNSQHFQKLQLVRSFPLIIILITH